MIEILLATYNGERFLTRQIESILAQSCQDFKISISDDCSNDCTLEILKAYENDKIKVISSSTHSAKENFFNLLDRANAEYIALCDQDDFWKKEKLEKSLKAMQKFENRYGKDMPILIHSDLEIVNENLQAEYQKMSDITGIKKALNSAKKNSSNLYIFNNEKALPRLLAENNITGNTVIFNKALLNLYKRPKISFMHDWWLGISAYAFGKVGYIDETLVKYRQHEDNELGAVNPLDTKNIQNRFVNGDNVRKNYDAMFAQAKEFLRLYRQEFELNNNAKFAYKILTAFTDMKNKNRISKIIDICKYKFFKSSTILTIGEMLSI